MPQKSTDGVNMMNKCWYCVENFKETDGIVFRGTKLYHNRCIQELDNKVYLKPYEEKYSYLSQQHLENLLHEGEHTFKIIDDNDWIVILDGSTSTEINILGYKSEKELKEFLKRHHNECEGGWEVSAIYNCGTRYFYRAEIKIILTPSKLG